MNNKLLSSIALGAIIQCSDPKVDDQIGAQETAVDQETASTLADPINFEGTMFSEKLRETMADSHDHLRAIQSYNTAEGNLAETSTILFPGSELTVRSFTSPVSSPVIKAIRMFVSIFIAYPSHL